MKQRVHSVSVIASVLALGLVLAFVASAGARTKARIKHDSGTAYVYIVDHSGSTDYVAGYTFDKLFGQTATTYVATVLPGTATGTVKVSARRVTLYTPNGSLVGSGSALEDIATGAITNGKLALTRGTGGQKGHKFVGTFTGSLSKSGLLTFHYKGIYR